MKRRTIDELVSYIEGFLNELYSHFNTNGCVIFNELQIERNGTKYHLNGRLRCEIMKAEFIESHRYYTRKYNTPPTREAILSWIQVSCNLRATEHKRNYKRDNSHYNEILIRRKEHYKNNKEEILTIGYEYYHGNKDEINKRRRKRKKTERERRRLAEIENINHFNEEFEKARPKMRNFFKTITNDYDELVQEVYVEAYKCRHRYKYSTNMSAWAIGIGKNINLQKLKKNKREKNTVVFFGDINDDVMSNAASKISLEELFNEENKVVYPENTVETIHWAMNELSIKDKQLLELYMNGKKHAEIANILGIDENYSKTRLYLIRVMLAKKVEPKLNVKIKTYGDANPSEFTNRNAAKKTYYFRNKIKKVS